jgi:hypothetical protein
MFLICNSIDKKCFVVIRNSNFTQCEHLREQNLRSVCALTHTVLVWITNETLSNEFNLLGGEGEGFLHYYHPHPQTAQAHTPDHQALETILDPPEDPPEDLHQLRLHRPQCDL